jgi:hypothetical protein
VKTAVIIFVAFMAMTSFAWEPIVLENGDFSNIGQDGIPAGWTQNKYYKESGKIEVVKQGEKNVLKITPVEKDPTACLLDLVAFPTQDTKKLKVTLNAGGGIYSVGIVLLANQWGKGLGNEKAEGYSIEPKAKVFEFDIMKKDAEEKDAKAYGFRLVLCVPGGGKGPVTFSDIKIEWE